MKSCSYLHGSLEAVITDLKLVQKVETRPGGEYGMLNPRSPIHYPYPKSCELWVVVVASSSFPLEQ